MPVSNLVLFHWDVPAGKAITAQLSSAGLSVTQATTLDEAEAMIADTQQHHVLILDNGSAGGNAALTRALALKLHAEDRVPFVRITTVDISAPAEVGSGVWTKNTDIQDLVQLILSVVKMS